LNFDRETKTTINSWIRSNMLINNVLFLTMKRDELKMMLDEDQMLILIQSLD